MMHVLWTENDLSAATDDIGCTERSLSDWIGAINGITLIVCYPPHRAKTVKRWVGQVMMRTLG